MTTMIMVLAFIGLLCVLTTVGIGLGLIIGFLLDHRRPPSHVYPQHGEREPRMRVGHDGVAYLEVT